MYDGYHFTHNVEGVYNPFCLLKCLKSKDFGSYWFESGTPSFLVKTLQNQPLELTTIINGRKAKEDQFKNYDPDSKNMLPVIYQSGYLTIKGFEKTKMDKGRVFEEVACEALEQISANGYADHFAVAGKRLFKIGVVFSSDGKGMIGWKVQE